jgi:hypothetical protein
MNTFADVINRWPSAAAFASDLKITGLRARQWRRRNSIPAGKWLDVIAAAEARGFDGITVDRLASIAASSSDTNGKAA